MLTLTQVGCDHIVANSDVIQDLILNPCDFEKVDIEVNMNCCGAVHTETIMIPTLPGCVITDWKIIIPKGQTTLILTGIWFRNLLIGTRFQVPTPPLTILTATDLVSFFNTVDAFFNANYGTPLGTITVTVTSNLNNYEVKVTGVPQNFAPDTMTFTVDGLDVEPHFHYVVSANNTLFTTAGIVLNSNIIGADAFPDGIYKVKVTLWRPSGSRVAQQNCLFFDCNTACKVSAELTTATTDEQTELLMLHYGLTKGSNCACDCDQLCKLYQRLHMLLTNTQIQDCGC